MLRSEGLADNKRNEQVDPDGRTWIDIDGPGRIHGVALVVVMPFVAISVVVFIAAIVAVMMIISHSGSGKRQRNN